MTTKCFIFGVTALLFLSNCNSKSPQPTQPLQKYTEEKAQTKVPTPENPPHSNSPAQPNRPLAPPKVENFTPDTCTLELATKCKDPAKCVGKNPEHFTPGCRKHIVAFLSLLTNTKTACQKDIILLCKNNPDQFQAMRCLMQNRNALSKECLQTLPPMPL